MANPQIGRRIKALREERGLSQDELAEVLGVKDRQTVSAMENGARRVRAEELLAIVERLGVPLDYFTDPFRLDGEARFSWRQNGVPRDGLDEYERTASRWIGAYRTLAAQVGREAPLLRRALGLSRASSFEDAMHAGERFVREMELGPVPAVCLRASMEAALGILVLMVDATRGISGAACRLPELDIVLIVRGEVAGRRHFDLAHELFHLLTWDAMPPEHLEEAGDASRNRVERLANTFAAAVLMPAEAVASVGGWADLGRNALIARLNAVADELQVTSSALRWRLVALGYLNRVQAESIPEGRLRNNGHGRTRHQLPTLFSRPFAEVLGAALDQGHISVRRAAALVGLPMEALVELLTAHHVEHAIDL